MARALGCVLFLRQAPSPAVTVSIGASWAMETTLSRKWTKSRTRGRKLHLTEAKARVGRARKTRADLERQLKACKREIANARERLIEATKQQTATSEMLRIIADSPLQSVLDAVAEHAARLCDSNHAEIYRLENNHLRLVAAYGDFPVHIQAREGFPVNRDRVIGRTICDRRTVHVHDLAAEDSEYPLGSSDAKRLGHRTTLGTPLLRERTPIGGILFRRFEVRPFSDNQIALLESFAGQAAIAIENVRLFEAEKQRTLALAQANRDLAEREAKIRRLVDANIIGIFIWTIDGRFIEANDAFLRMVGYDREELISDRVHRMDLTPPEWHKRLELTLAELKMTGIAQPYEKEYFRKDGSRVPVLIGAAAFDEKRDKGVAFVLDLTERKRAEEALHKVQMALAHANRVSAMGQLTASVAHEIRQPLAGVKNSGNAALRWLTKHPLGLEEAKRSLENIIKAADRANDVISRIHNIVKKDSSSKDTLDINEAILEVLTLVRGEAVKHDVSIQMRLATNLPRIVGDRVQLQQVMINLIINAIQAMSAVQGMRELHISTERSETDGVSVAVRDFGPGLSAQDLSNLFEPFYTTKPEGMGMGLSISRSIIEYHGGRLWASQSEPHGALFQFTIPAT